MKYGPFDGIYFKSKTQFYKFVCSRILHRKYRVEHKYLPLRFQSRLLGEALSQHHPDFINRKLTINFVYLPLGSKHRLCAVIDDEYIPFAYKKILANT